LTRALGVPGLALHDEANAGPRAGFEFSLMPEASGATEVESAAAHEAGAEAVDDAGHRARRTAWGADDPARLPGHAPVPPVLLAGVADRQAAGGAPLLAPAGPCAG
jgi:hypothetical protein